MSDKPTLGDYAGCGGAILLGGAALTFYAGFFFASLALAIHGPIKAVEDFNTLRAQEKNPLVSHENRVAISDLGYDFGEAATGFVGTALIGGLALMSAGQALREFRPS